MMRQRIVMRLQLTARMGRLSRGLGLLAPVPSLCPIGMGIGRLRVDAGEGAGEPLTCGVRVPASRPISTRSFFSRHKATPTGPESPEAAAGSSESSTGAETASSSSSAWLLQEADRVWSQAAADPQRLDAATTLRVLRMLQRCGEMQRQLAIITQALQLEKQQAAEVERKAAAEPSMTAGSLEDAALSSVSSSAGKAGESPRDPPVFVDEACFAVLFESLAGHHGLPLGLAAAQAVHDSMQQRHAAAIAQRQHSGEQKEQVDSLALNAYLSFLRHSGLTDEVLRVWSDQSAADRQSNPRGLAVVLRPLALADDGHLRAARLMDTDGACVPWSAEVCLAWLSCFGRRSDWAGAEDAWRCMQQRGIAFDCDLYAQMLQIYIGSGDAAQLAKVEPLYAQMRGRRGMVAPDGQQSSQPPLPLRFSLRHFEQHIQAAHHARSEAPTSRRQKGSGAAVAAGRSALDAEILKWSGRAVAAGGAEQIDSHVFQIIRQAIRRLRDQCDESGHAAGRVDQGVRTVRSSLRADPRDVTARVAFMAELFDLPLGRLTDAAEARGLQPMPGASREALIGRLVGGTRRVELREAARLSRNQADVD